MNGRIRTAASTALAVLGLATVLATPASAAPASPGARPGGLPDTISLPDGFPPEGIAIGGGPFAYLGSRADGSIYRANLITGTGRVISQGPGTPSLGIKIDDRGRLFVAGGTGGDARVVDARTGTVLAHYQFATAGASFVNDEILTPGAAYFTDSTNPVLYKVPLGRHGALPAADAFVTIPLTGDIVYGAGINANGIVRTPDGRGLIIVQSNTGQLFRVDPATGVTTRVDLGTAAVPNGDGLLLLGRTLFVVQNANNAVAVIRLDSSGGSGVVLRRVTDPRFDTPTTIAAFAGRLYAPNARFGVAPTPTTTYTVVAIPIP